MSKKTEVFKSVLDKFETDEMKSYCIDMIELIDDSIFKIPASTTYKYHNKTQCSYGGQCYHVLMASTIMNYILELDYVKENFIKFPKQRDCMRTAILLHDAIKTGKEYGNYTVFEHPVLAKEWVRTTNVNHDVDDNIKEYIGNLIVSHSGQWNKSNRSEMILPTPSNNEEFIVHLCDYLGSRANLDMIYDEETRLAVERFVDLPEFEEPEKYCLPFGKYKGKTLEYVKENDSQYLTWMKDNIVKEPLKSILKRI